MTKSLSNIQLNHYYIKSPKSNRIRKFRKTSKKFTIPCNIAISSYSAWRIYIWLNSHTYCSVPSLYWRSMPRNIERLSRSLLPSECFGIGERLLSGILECRELYAFYRNLQMRSQVYNHHTKSRTFSGFKRQISTRNLTVPKTVWVHEPISYSVTVSRLKV